MIPGSLALLIGNPTDVPGRTAGGEVGNIGAELVPPGVTGLGITPGAGIPGGGIIAGPVIGAPDSGVGRQVPLGPVQMLPAHGNWLSVGPHLYTAL
jgi:hypothetical protein